MRWHANGCQDKDKDKDEDKDEHHTRARMRWHSIVFNCIQDKDKDEDKDKDKDEHHTRARMQWHSIACKKKKKIKKKIKKKKKKNSLRSNNARTRERARRNRKRGAAREPKGDHSDPKRVSSAEEEQRNTADFARPGRRSGAEFATTKLATLKQRAYARESAGQSRLSIPSVASRQLPLVARGAIGSVSTCRGAEFATTHFLKRHQRSKIIL